MLRHRRHASLDSHAFGNILSIRQSYTLQSTNPSGLRTARLAAHTSPLATAISITPPMSPRTDTSEEQMDLEEEMEKMVSSVVNSPTDPTMMSARHSVAPVSLVGALQSQQLNARSALSVPPTKSLLGSNTLNDPKHNMGMRAAVGSFRKRCLSVHSVAVGPPSLMVSQPSPTRTSSDSASELQHKVERTPEDSTGSLLSPPSVRAEQSLAMDNDDSPRTRHRRSASVGAGPSLDQIREWSLRRHNAASETGVPTMTPTTNVSSEPFTFPKVPPGLVQPMQSSLPASRVPTNRPSRLARILRHRSFSASSNGRDFFPPTRTDEDQDMRLKCARQMVNVLEKRKSPTLIA